MKDKHIWIYEYKNDETVPGATFFEGHLSELDYKEVLKLPHLRDDWHWRVSVVNCDCEEWEKGD